MKKSQVLSMKKSLDLSRKKSLDLSRHCEPKEQHSLSKTTWQGYHRCLRDGSCNFDMTRLGESNQCLPLSNVEQMVLSNVEQLVLSIQHPVRSTFEQVELNIEYFGSEQGPGQRNHMMIVHRNRFDEVEGILVVVGCVIHQLR